MSATDSFLSDIGSNSLVERLKKAKQSRSVLKVKFASFSSMIPDDVKILACEGPDDKILYHYWIFRINEEFSYENYQCDGKKNVLQLFDILAEDKTGLGDNVYFLVDKDFDGLQGRNPSNKIFQTEKYSIESYLVCENILDDLLRVNFHCNGKIECRQKVISKFNEIYEKFLSLSKEINFNVFLARKFNIDIDNLPSSLHGFIVVDLDDVRCTDKNADDFLDVKEKLTEEQIAEARIEFENLNCRNDYRGKFALSFFTRWLGLLRSDRIADDSTFFEGIEKSNNSISGDFSFSNLALRARVPDKFREFILSIPE